MKTNVHKYKVILTQTGEIIANGTAKECAAAMGVTLNSFYSFEYQSRDAFNPKYTITFVGSAPKSKKSSTKYFVSDSKGKPIVEGVATVCAEALGMNMHGFYSMVTRSIKGENKKYQVRKEKIKE